MAVSYTRSEWPSCNRMWSEAAAVCDWRLQPYVVANESSLVRYLAPCWACCAEAPSALSDGYPDVYALHSRQVSTR